jgi:hypothetical protein
VEKLVGIVSSDVPKLTLRRRVRLLKRIPRDLSVRFEKSIVFIHFHRIAGQDVQDIAVSAKDMKHSKCNLQLTWHPLLVKQLQVTDRLLVEGPTELSGPILENRVGLYIELPLTDAFCSFTSLQSFDI